MPVNDIITQAEYNNIRNKVLGVLGTGSGNSGYGQPFVSTAVAEGNSITINEYANLRYDIFSAYVHQVGSNPSTVTVVEGDTVRFSAIDAPVTTYDALANTLISNRFNVGAGQSATNIPTAPSSTTWPGIYGTSWNSLIQCTVTATWPDSNQARYFWNSGGQIRFTASRSGGSSTTQNTQWTSILSTAGIQTYGGNNPGAGTSPNDGQNWYRCTNTRQLWYSQSGSSPYGSNTYKIYARTLDASNNSTGTARQGEWHIEFVDNYTDPFEFVSPPPADSVDGTFTVAVSLQYATGILVPPSQGSFTVTLPTVTISAIAP